MPKISFNLQTQGTMARDVESADVCGPGGPNAIPSVMEQDVLRQSAVETVGLTDVACVPITVRGQLTKDIDARSFVVRGADLVQLETIPARPRYYGRLH